MALRVLFFVMLLGSVMSLEWESGRRPHAPGTAMVESDGSGIPPRP